MSEAWDYLKKERSILTVCAVVALFTIGLSPYVSLLADIAKNTLHLREGGYGGLQAAAGFGALAGALGLSISSRTHGKRTVIVVSVYTSQRLRDEISDLVERARYLLVINLEHVRYMDSTGLGVLIGGLKRVREFDGTVKLVCTNQNIVKIFNITGLTRIFSIFEDEAAAIEAILKERNGHVRDD